MTAKESTSGETVTCPDCDEELQADNGVLLSDLEWHVLREHGWVRE